MANETLPSSVRAQVLSLIALSAAAPATTVSGDQMTPSVRGVIVTIDITAVAAQSMVVTVQGKDPTSGKYYTILASAALVAIGTTNLVIYPDMTAAANLAVNMPLPPVWRVSCVGTGGTITMTVGASTII